MNINLIIPIAAHYPKFDLEIPPLFRMDNKGILVCLRSISGLELDVFKSIYVTILKKHDDLYNISDLLNLQFKRLGLINAKVVILNNPTNSQAETIYETIRQEKINGSVFIKDADCSFVGEIVPYNSIAIYSLNKLNLVDPQRKSYVVIDDGFYITNIIEKRIVSQYFNAGAYVFEDVDEFVKYYKSFQVSEGLCLSHIIYKMLLDKIVFRPILVNEYNDFDVKLYKIN